MGRARYHEIYTDPLNIPEPVQHPCCCRKDDDGYRWYNLGCRLHTALWRPSFNTQKWSTQTALSGADRAARNGGRSK